MALKPEQFTEQAQEVLHNSEEMVRRYKHAQWDVEHVLTALLDLEKGTPEAILSELGIEADLSASVAAPGEGAGLVPYREDQ